MKSHGNLKSEVGKTQGAIMVQDLLQDSGQDVGKGTEQVSRERLSFAVRIGLIMLAVVWLALVASSWAQCAEDFPEAGRAPAAASSDSNRDEASAEYRFDWLDPDKKVYVLQNRKYLKALRPTVSVIGGLSSSSAYRTTQNLEGRVGYALSEAWVLEVFYSNFFNQDNTTYKALTETNPNQFPVIRDIKSEVGALVHWVPWYAKINVFNQVLYFDWSFAAGVSSLSTDLLSRANKNAPVVATSDPRTGFLLATGQQYFVSRSLFVRLDYTASIYSAPVFGNTGESSWFSNSRFGIGFGYRF